MNRIFWKTVYRVIIFPVIVLIAHITGIFSKKIREVLLEKYAVFRNMKQWLENEPGPAAANVLFHAASLGEFEHIRPVLYQLKKRYNTRNIVTFYSPSGRRNVKTGNGVDYFCYMPYDTIPGWKKIYRLLDPAMVVVAKHDVWPAQIWTAKDLDIPVFLINASLSEKSTRSRFVFGRILSVVYRDFTDIMTISKEDHARFQKSFSGLTLQVTGDTKYDQVLLRMEHARHDPPLDKKWRSYSKIFAAGSIWPEDEVHLIPALKRLLTHHENLKIILVPHEPTKAAVARLTKKFDRYNPARFSELENRMPQSRVLLVDQIGHLAGLYDIADIAYVGGSFRQGIHNAMEPAVYGIPVLYGPVHTNSHEAIKLLEAGGARMVKDQKEIYSLIESLLSDDTMAGGIGKKAREYALKNTGATEKLITSWAEILGGKI